MTQYMACFISQCLKVTMDTLELSHEFDGFFLCTGVNDTGEHE